MLKQKFIFIIGIIIVFLVINDSDIFESDSTTQNNINPYKSGNSPTKPLVKANSISLHDKLSNKLIKAGWDSNATHAVIALNQEWLEILQTEYPQDFEKQVNLLKNLGNYPHLMPEFKTRPEIAALLAGADDPEYLAQSLKLDQYYDVVLGLFVQHTAPEDATALAEALEIHRSLIYRLIKRGLIGSQALFIFPRNNPGVSEYDHWLAEILEHALGQSDEKLSSIINLLFEQGTIIRSKMIDDVKFRHSFRNDLWPKLIRVLNKSQLPFELYVNDQHLWDLLALPQGERLLEQWVWFLSLEQVNNLTPADVLFGEETYPTPLHSYIVTAILDEDANTLIALLYFGHSSLFVELMQRQLPEKVKQKVFNILIAQSSNYLVKLEDWSKASDADLYFELINNDSSLGHTIKKTIQGRKVSGGEAFWATLDVADIVIMTATLGTGAIITSTVKLGAKKGAKSLLKSQAKDVFQRNSITKKIVDKISEKALMSSGQKQFIEKTQQVFNQFDGKIPEHAKVDVTSTLQFFFKKMNINRKTIKRINNSWDARLFMRKDSKVLINVDYKKLSSATCLFFKIASAVDTAGTSVVVKETVCGLVDNFKSEAMSKRIASLENKQQSFQAWQKNNSAWWLMNASNMKAQ